MFFQPAAPLNRPRIFRQLRSKPEDSEIRTASEAKGNREKLETSPALVHAIYRSGRGREMERAGRGAQKESLRVLDSATASPPLRADGADREDRGEPYVRPVSILNRPNPNLLRKSGMRVRPKLQWRF